MDLSVSYMGLNLKHPLVAAASPLSRDVAGIRKLEDAGASAIVLPSLFEEQISQEGRVLDHFLTVGTESYAEAINYFPDSDNYHVGPDEYLKLIAKAKTAVKAPIIASLNGVSVGGWTKYAHLMEEAGADALELNIYYIPTDPFLSGSQIEKMYIDTVREVKSNVNIPVAVKVGPYFSATAWMARRFAEIGASAMVMFNRFYQPDIDLVNLEVVPRLVFSNSDELRLPLRWVAILFGRVPMDFAVTSGVHTHEDVLKAMMAGANVVMLASELLEHGLGRIEAIRAGMEAWMEEFEYTSVKQMQGSLSQRNVAEPAAFERANYMKLLQSFNPDPLTNTI